MEKFYHIRFLYSLYLAEILKLSRAYVTEICFLYGNNCKIYNTYFYKIKAIFSSQPVTFAYLYISGSTGAFKKFVKKKNLIDEFVWSQGFKLIQKHIHKYQKNIYFLVL